MNEKNHRFMFRGDFKKLKSLGFEFQKYYASNYIGYTFKATEYSDWIIAWKKHKDISMFDEIKYFIRPAIFEFIKNNTMEEIKSKNLFEHDKIGYFKMNEKTGEIVSFNNDEKTYDFNLRWNFIEKLKELINLGYIELVIED
ncbi:MAG: hypothetical protein ACRCXX_13475 [Cetobacterium sp.]|uniref:hypothetical protein n=1 Tax=Cetobacterium sp. TaxID=2071632 RepID=UPI003F2A0E1C